MRTLGPWLLFAALMLLVGWGSQARAVAPLGACCLPSGACQDLVDLQCTAQGGTFIGFATSCRTIDCNAPLAAPLLSVFGMVAVAGALGGWGVYRLFVRHRPAGS